MSNISLLKWTVYGVTVTVLGLGSMACSNSSWREVEGKEAPNTGDVMAERQRLPKRNRNLQREQTVYTNSDRLLGRKKKQRDLEERQQPSEYDEPERRRDEPVVFEKGDELKVIDPVPQGEEGLIEVVKIDTRNPELPQEPVLVHPDYVAEEPPKLAAADRYIMIQNIATEKVRVYERCVQPLENGDCPHRLVLETDMSAGEDTPDKSRRSILGSFRITAWFKFYEDGANLFPSWYRASYPQLPAPGASLDQWLSKSLVPDKRGSMRGSFGWYTAHVGPNADAQWTHGTFGWGKDGGKFIELVRDEKINAKMDPRSMGCTRVENQAIAWMREKLPVGTKVLKVYAREDYADAERTRYQDFELARWDWILTKQSPNESGAMSADAVRVQRAGVRPSDILERGTYTPDQVPSAIELTGESEGAIASNGNLYNIPKASFKGVFLVDEGRFKNYVHPKELRVGGHADHGLPSIVVAK